MKEITGGVCAPLGFKAGSVHAGIKEKDISRKDLSLIVSDVVATTSATYTLNKVKGAPLTVTKKHLKNGLAKAIICNSGNANTCNLNGIDLANDVCHLLSEELNINEEDIVVASTGVIGQEMSIDPFRDHMKELVESVKEDNSLEAVKGIMTTDTVPKQFAVEFELDGRTCHIGAIAKGSGMIHPNMATMLAFVTSDVDISKEMLDIVIHEVVDDTFNMVSVDGDTSTNDMLVVMSNGLAQNRKIVFKDRDYQIFKEALYDVCEKLSKAIAKDGEGATKLLIADVVHGKSTVDAKKIAKSIITSSLFKAAMFGKDANWGRILCAIGYSDANVDVTKIDVHLISNKGDLFVCHNGMGVPFSEDEASNILAEDEITISVDLNDGDYEATAYGCDLTYDYVKINGDYRT